MSLQKIVSAVMILIALSIVVLTISVQLMIAYGICDLEINENSTGWVCEAVNEQS